jgi:hypothetical protein
MAYEEIEKGFLLRRKPNLFEVSRKVVLQQKGSFAAER